jgi:membrane-associated phospholipid phosphatase
MLAYLTSGNDMFFSSHTGLPFLMSLIFWGNYRLRIFFILASMILAASVLLGHLHYSIDVFAAYFITYTIFHIAQKFFKQDYELLLKDDSTT